MSLASTYTIKQHVLKILFLAFLLLVFLSSCDPNRIYEKNIRVSPNGWSVGEKVLFEAPIIDSVVLCNFYINLRHTEDYKFSNLYLFIDTYVPQGQHARDTIELILADKTGKWYGEGFGKIKEYQVLIRQGVVFPVTGVYNIAIQHGMRETELQGIEDVGIRFERMK